MSDIGLPSYRMYHYRRDIRPRDLDTLMANKAWASSVDSLNDPFEFAALSALEAHPDRRSQLQNAGVTCFCRALTNPLLWSHYADAHKGFAIAYDYAHSFFGSENGPHGRIALEVRYEDVAPSLDFYSVSELVTAAVTTKPTCWAYEQEVRLISLQSNALIDIPREAVKEIAFGAKMPANRTFEIMAAVREAGIKARFIQMQFIKEGFGVKPVWVTA